ncbi:MAG: hypothetical protein JW737_06675 [Acidobacteria bacterium]|nr:hypothetical protein [Acidobacteriota bacterium]
MKEGKWRLCLRDESEYHDFPATNWEDVEKILQNLDGSLHDDSFLEYTDSSGTVRLTMGGGETKRVVLGVQAAGEDCPVHLIDPSAGDELIVQSVGGQETPLPAKLYIPLNMALQATHYFYQHQQPDPSLHWAYPWDLEAESR